MSQNDILLAKPMDEFVLFLDVDVNKTQWMGCLAAQIKIAGDHQRGVFDARIDLYFSITRCQTRTTNVFHHDDRIIGHSLVHTSHQ